MPSEYHLSKERAEEIWAKRIDYGKRHGIHIPEDAYTVDELRAILTRQMQMDNKATFEDAVKSFIEPDGKWQMSRERLADFLLKDKNAAAIRHNIQNPEFGQHDDDWDFHWSGFVNGASAAIWDQLDEYAKIAIYLMADDAARKAESDAGEDA